MSKGAAKEKEKGAPGAVGPTVRPAVLGRSVMCWDGAHCLTQLGHAEREVGDIPCCGDVMPCCAVLCCALQAFDGALRGLGIGEVIELEVSFEGRGVVRLTADSSALLHLY